MPGKKAEERRSRKVKGEQRLIQTMPNERPGVPTWVENRVELPCCCPVSQNPQAGSRLFLRYRAGAQVLEVYSLQRSVAEFIGGHPDGARNMETMIQKIAQDCADALGMPVTARAELQLLPRQQMILLCRATPTEARRGSP